MSEMLAIDDNGPLARCGTPPDMRSIEQLLDAGLVVLDKPRGPTSHQVSAWLRNALGREQAGHGGTLDPHVTGVLPVAFGRAARALRVLQYSPKAYITVMEHRSDPGEEALRAMMERFTGPIYQIPPEQAAVKRQLRVRHIYQLELHEHAPPHSLFSVTCEAGTYIRNLCRDLGMALGTGGRMAQLRRTRTGLFDEAAAVPLVRVRDAYETWRETGDEAALRAVVLPLEAMLAEMPALRLKDSAVDAVCHGAPLGRPGVAAVSREVARGGPVVLFTRRGEAVALAEAQMDAVEMAERSGRGLAAQVTRVLMEPGTYPRGWKREGDSAE